VERAYALKQGPTCRVSYTANSWGTGFTADVKITNTGPTAVNGWTLAWAFAGDQRITNAWNGVATQNGKQVSVTNTAGNPTIAPGASTSFGFQGTYTGTNTDPSTFTLNRGHYICSISVRSMSMSNGTVSFTRSWKIPVRP
jgi:hypothetical protein